MASTHWPAEIRNILEGALTARQAADNATAAPVPVWIGDEAFNMTTPMQQFGFAIVLFFPLLAFICCCLRVYSRVSTKQMAVDDYLVIVAMVCVLAVYPRPSAQERGILLTRNL